MTCSTFILIDSAGGRRHHGIASSSLLYYNTFVFILLPRTGLNALRGPKGAPGPGPSAGGDSGMTEGFSGRAPSLAALAIFLRGEYYAAAAATAAIAHAIAAVKEPCWFP